MSPPSAGRCKMWRARNPTRKSSYPAHAGYPVRCGFSIPSLASLEYWVARSSRVMTVVGVARSRARIATDSIFKQPRLSQPGQSQTRLYSPAARSARAVHEFPPERAQGTPGAGCTRGLVCNSAQKNAHEHTGSAEAIRHSLRNGFTAYFVLSPAIGLSCHRRQRDISR